MTYKCTVLETEQYLPKNGIRKAAQTVDITSAVLRRRKHQLVREMLSGNNSSTLLASGFIIKAYVFIIKEKMKLKFYNMHII
jgi:hypothetical protein